MANDSASVKFDVSEAVDMNVDAEVSVENMAAEFKAATDCFSRFWLWFRVVAFFEKLKNVLIVDFMIYMCFLMEAFVS